MSRRKFLNSSVTSVRCERSAITLADSMDIVLADALLRGILFEAEFKLDKEPEKYSAETHDLFLALKKKDLAEFEEWLGIQKMHEKRIAEYAEVQRKAEEPEPTLRVYARDLEQVIDIPQSQYDPEYHSIRRKA